MISKDRILSTGTPLYRMACRREIIFNNKTKNLDYLKQDTDCIYDLFSHYQHCGHSPGDFVENLVIPSLPTIRDTLRDVFSPWEEDGEY